MNTFLFTVYDSVAGRYLEPFCSPSVEFAMREFGTAVNKEGSQFNKYPSDYTLFFIGEFSQETGKLDGKEPTSLGVAVTFLKSDISIDDLRAAAPLGDD